MDLHFTEAAATCDERATVDEVLGEPDTRWIGSERDERSSRLAEGGHAARDRRHLLLPVLHAVQDRMGWISPGALNYLCQRLTIPPADAFGVADFYALLATTPQPPTVVHICDDIACKARGADHLCTTIEQTFGPAGEPGENGQTTWQRSPCLGLCEKAPAAFLQCAGTNRSNFTLAPVEPSQILTTLGGETCIGRVPGGSTPQVGQPGLQLLSRVGIVNPLSLDDYRAKGGYAALRRALEIGSLEVIRELADAKLTGRGGAAFPTHVKWKAVAEAPSRPHYIVCNADESEPGTFKDRVLMEQDPFSVIEAMTIAGFACGAEQGYLYIRGEYPEATHNLQNAIDQARTHGLLGPDIMARGFTFDIHIRRGGGAYICGEETALLNSIEGKRGEPRSKPPFPVQVGLFGKPTAINNVETLVNVLPTLMEGGQSYASTSIGGSTGTRLFCLSGSIERPGVYEVPYGATLGEVLEMAGGVQSGRKLQAILLGGAAGTFVRPDELDIPLTLEGARAADTTLGSGVIMAFDDTVDMKRILLRIAAFFRDESCGQCVPCRVGTVRQEEALHRLITAEGTSENEIALLGELEQVMKDSSICGLGHTAACAIMSAIRRLRMFQKDSLPLYSAIEQKIPEHPIPAS